MVLAWAFLFPLGILIARFFKVMPRQDWPDVSDNKSWWHGHLLLQYCGALVLAVALWLILSQPKPGLLFARYHALLGWAVVSLLAVQFASGWLRGSKGGPTDRRRDGSPRGDHFDMTPRRLLFERVHKTIGYAALILSCAAIVTGLLTAAAPAWMYVILLAWWALLTVLFVWCQRRGLHINTYQAIWGSTTSPYVSNLPRMQSHPWRKTQERSSMRAE